MASGVTNFKDLKIWKVAIELVKKAYKVSSKLPKEEMYGLTSQIRRAVISIPSNIAEGTGRDDDKEFQRFLDYAIGSLFELETQIILSKDLDYINTEDYESAYQSIKLLIRMIVLKKIP